GPNENPLPISMFDEKLEENLTTHITTYHMWHVSNSMLDNNIQLRIFPCTLTHAALNWFIELPTTSYHIFNALAMAILTNFQFPTQYKTITELM
uniref:hypothetical protein n=1 Tax=Staphylococcus aureus TaxID=1280 RepID=UPI00301BD807